MAEKMLKLKTRVINKHETQEDWEKAVNFIPLLAEIIVYDTDSTHTQARLKIGDGKTNVNDLPFMIDKTEVALKTDILSLDTTLSVEGSAADAKAVGDIIVSKQDSITGTEGQFVVIGADGKPTVKTIPSAEGVNF